MSTRRSFIPGERLVEQGNIIVPAFPIPKKKPEKKEGTDYYVTVRNTLESLVGRGDKNKLNSKYLGWATGPREDYPRPFLLWCGDEANEDGNTEAKVAQSLQNKVTIHFFKIMNPKELKRCKDTFATVGDIKWDPKRLSKRLKIEVVRNGKTYIAPRHPLSRLVQGLRKSAAGEKRKKKSSSATAPAPAGKNKRKAKKQKTSRPTKEQQQQQQRTTASELSQRQPSIRDVMPASSKKRKREKGRPAQQVPGGDVKTPSGSPARKKQQQHKKPVVVVVDPTPIASTPLDQNHWTYISPALLYHTKHTPIPASQYRNGESDAALRIFTQKGGGNGLDAEGSPPVGKHVMKWLPPPHDMMSWLKQQHGIKGALRFKTDQCLQHEDENIVEEDYVFVVETEETDVVMLEEDGESPSLDATQQQQQQQPPDVGPKKRQEAKKPFLKPTLVRKDGTGRRESSSSDQFVVRRPNWVDDMYPHRDDDGQEEEEEGGIHGFDAQGPHALFYSPPGTYDLEVVSKYRVRNVQHNGLLRVLARVRQWLMKNQCWDAVKQYDPWQGIEQALEGLVNDAKIIDVFRLVHNHLKTNDPVDLYFEFHDKTMKRLENNVTGTPLFADATRAREIFNRLCKVSPTSDMSSSTSSVQQDRMNLLYALLYTFVVLKPVKHDKEDFLSTISDDPTLQSLLDLGEEQDSDTSSIRIPSIRSVARSGSAHRLSPDEDSMQSWSGDGNRSDSFTSFPVRQKEDWHRNRFLRALVLIVDILCESKEGYRRGIQKIQKERDLKEIKTIKDFVSGRNDDDGLGSGRYRFFVLNAFDHMFPCGGRESALDIGVPESQLKAEASELRRCSRALSRAFILSPQTFVSKD